MSNKKRFPSGTKEDVRDWGAAPERAAFSDRLKAQMEKQGLSYEELSRRTNGTVSKSALQSYVARTSEPGKLIILITLADALGCSVDYLLGRTDEVPDPQAKGMPEYLGLTPAAVQAIHDSYNYAGEMYRQQTGVKAFSGLLSFSMFLEKYALEFFGDLAGLNDVQMEIDDYMKKLAQVKPVEFDVQTSMFVLQELETLQHKLVYAENRLQTLIRRALNAEMHLDGNKANLDQLHQMVVQQQTNPESVFYQQMKAYVEQSTPQTAAPAETSSN